MKKTIIQFKQKIAAKITKIAVTTVMKKNNYIAKLANTYAQKKHTKTKIKLNKNSKRTTISTRIMLKTMKRRKRRNS